MSNVAIHTVLQKICCFKCGYEKVLSEVLPMDVGPFSDLMNKLAKDHKLCLESEAGDNLKAKAMKASEEFEEKRIKSYYQKAIDLWGEESQVKQAVEELSELVVAINHNERGRCTYRSVLEEVADVEILIEQMKSIFIDSREEYNFTFKDSKLLTMHTCSKMSSDLLLAYKNSDRVPFYNINRMIERLISGYEIEAYNKIKQNKMEKFMKTVDDAMVLKKV